MTLGYVLWGADILVREFLSIYVSVLYSTKYSLAANNISIKAGTHMLQKLHTISWSGDIVPVNCALCDTYTMTKYGVPSFKSRTTVLGL